jgi:hypothetical protein
MSCRNNQCGINCLSATSANQTILSNTAIPFNTINLLQGNSIDFSGGTSILLDKPGIYLINVNANVLEASTTGTITMQIQKNGVNINGAVASANSASTTDSENLSIMTLVKVLPSCCMVDNNANITVLNICVASVYSNANITIVKLV